MAKVFFFQRLSKSSVCACGYGHLCVYIQLCAGAHESQKIVEDTLELEMYVLVSHLTFVLGTELGSFGTAASTLNH